MRTSAIATLALAAGANAWGNVTYTTEVVTAYTTYCPGPTTITQGKSTYTVTKATTLTITDCPCTVTKPVVPTLAVATSVPAVKYTTTPVVPVVVKTTTPAVPVVVKTTTPYYSVPAASVPVAPVGTAPAVPVVPGTTTSPSAAVFTGAGSKAAASGLSLAGLAAVAAFFL